MYLKLYRWSDRFSSTRYNACWYETPVHIQKMFKFVIQNTLKPYQLGILEIICITFESMSKVYISSWFNITMILRAEIKRRHSKGIYRFHWFFSQNSSLRWISRSLGIVSNFHSSHGSIRYYSKRSLLWCKCFSVGDEFINKIMH